MKSVLHVGCGVLRGHLPPWFDGWREVCVDIDADVKPDIVADIVSMPVADAAFDGLWSSHNIEHLHPSSAARALAEFARVLRPEGFAVVTCPDLRAAAERVAAGMGDAVAYEAPCGPITAMDMLFGHAGMTAGNPHMAHRWGWTVESLSQAMGRAGFGHVQAWRGDDLAIWALGVKA